MPREDSTVEGRDIPEGPPPSPGRYSKRQRSLAKIKHGRIVGNQGGAREPFLISWRPTGLRSSGGKTVLMPWVKFRNGKGTIRTIPAADWHDWVARMEALACGIEVIPEDEEWRPAVDFEGRYEVSDYGRVRGLDRMIRSKGSGMRHLRGCIFHPWVDPAGRPIVTLRMPGRKFRTRICILVATAFIGPRPPGMECCHDDGNPANNHPENLRWDTRQSNMDDRGRHGQIRKGEQMSISKLTASDVREARRRRKLGHTYQAIGDDFGVAGQTIRAAVIRETWKHIE